MEFEEQERTGRWSHKYEESLNFEWMGGNERELCKITLNSSSFTEIKSGAKKFGSMSLNTLIKIKTVRKCQYQTFS